MNIVYICSIGILLTCLAIFLFTLLSSKYTTKALLITVAFISAFTAYFMDTYHVIIDDGMIRNTLQTNIEESADYLGCT